MVYVRHRKTIYAYGIYHLRKVYFGKLHHEVISNSKFTSSITSLKKGLF